MADERAFNLTITTPDRDFYKGSVVKVEINTTEGQIGVLKITFHLQRLLNQEYVTSMSQIQM